MTREEKIRILLDIFTEPRSVKSACEIVGMAYKSVYVYLQIMERYGIFERTSMKSPHGGRPINLFKTIVKDLTPERMKQVCKAITVGIEESKSNSTAIKTKITSADNTEATQREAKGIYMLTSKPSQHFIDKFIAQNTLIRKEYKSPKNYAGTSEGLVW